MIILQESEFLVRLKSPTITLSLTLLECVPIDSLSQTQGRFKDRLMHELQKEKGSRLCQLDNNQVPPKPAVLNYSLHYSLDETMTAFSMIVFKFRNCFSSSAWTISLFIFSETLWDISAMCEVVP